MTDDDIVVVAEPLPRLLAVSPRDGFRLVVAWESPPSDAGAIVVDLAPAILRYGIYAPLRDDPDLFRTVRVTDDGFAVAWDHGDLDMASTTIADLSESSVASPTHP